MQTTKETVIRSAALFLALLNQVLTALGKNPLPFSDEQLYAGISALVSAALALWAWWKNNSFTPEACAADQLLHQLKEERGEDAQ